MAAEPRDDAQHPRNRSRRRDAPNEATESLTEAEWRALLAAVDEGHLEDVDA